MASWKEERDRLVAQTLAFVQQVAAAHPAKAGKPGLTTVAPLADAKAAAPTELSAPQIVEATEPPPEISLESTLPVVDTESPPTSILIDLPKRPAQYRPPSERSDIADRVAAFKARQMVLNQEREAYYDSVQARIRSSLRNDNDAGRL